MKRKTNVLYMSELAILVAIVLIMAYTPLGYLKTPWGVEITFMVVPVAVGAVILGPSAGAFLGLVFGLTSFAQCFSGSPIATMFLQESPLGTFFCCVITRIFVGWAPGLLYQALKRFEKTRHVRIALCCILTPLMNTFLYILFNWLIFSDTWLSLTVSSGYTGGKGFSLLTFMLALVGINGITEAISCLILSTAVCKALQKTIHRNEVYSAI